MMRLKKEILIHILFWFWFWIFPSIINNFYSQKNQFFTGFGRPIFLSQFFLGNLIFYIQYLFVIPRFLKKGRINRSFILAIIGLFFLYVVLRYSIEEVLYLKLFGIHNYTKGTRWHFYIFDNLYWGGRFIMWATLIWYIINYTKLEKEKYDILKSKNQAEVNFLRSQINPHFIFNTLNNIYSLVYHKSDKALPAIDKLSELMRFITDDAGKEQIKLSKEISYIHSIIELATLRNANASHIEFNVDGNIEAQYIAPLILIPFVENGLKHGDISNPAQPFTITLTATGNSILLQTVNLVKHKQGDDTKGIGLDNVKKRLALLYPNQYSLEIDDSNNIYTCNLKITLK